MVGAVGISFDPNIDYLWLHPTSSYLPVSNESLRLYDNVWHILVCMVGIVHHFHESLMFHEIWYTIALYKDLERVENAVELSDSNLSVLSFAFIIVSVCLIIKLHGDFVWLTLWSLKCVLNRIGSFI